MTVGITELPPEGMQLPGVALAGDPERGTKTTEGISLLFTTAGVTVQGPQPQIERLLVWSALDSATCREKVAAARRPRGGHHGADLGRAVDPLPPARATPCRPGQAAYLDQALPTWLLRYKGAAAPVAARRARRPGRHRARGRRHAPAPGTVRARQPPPSGAAPAVETPAPAFAAAAATGASGRWHTTGRADRSQRPGRRQRPGHRRRSSGATDLAGAPTATATATGGAPQQTVPPDMQAPPLAAPPAPPAPSAPTCSSPPPPPPPMAQAPVGPANRLPPPPPARPTPAAAPTVAPPTGWDDPPLGLTGPDDIAPAGPCEEAPVRPHPEEAAGGRGRVRRRGRRGRRRHRCRPGGTGGADRADGRHPPGPRPAGRRRDRRRRTWRRRPPWHPRLRRSPGSP